MASGIHQNLCFILNKHAHPNNLAAISMIISMTALRDVVGNAGKTQTQNPDSISISPDKAKHDLQL